MDYAGPVDGQMLSVAVDTYNKWLEVFSGSSGTSAVTIPYLRRMMSTYEVLAMIVSYIVQLLLVRSFSSFAS